MGIDAPSVRMRAALAASLLIGFYVFILGTAAFAALAGPAVFVGILVLANIQGSGNPSVPIGWIGIGTIIGVTVAFLLLKALFTIKRKPFEDPEGKRLSREESPALFATLDELAARARTEGPNDVYLVDAPMIAVTERAGLFGTRGRRILVLGAPTMLEFTVDELRSAIAHELGHFAFGDTRLLGLSSFAHESLRHVIADTENRGSPTDLSSLPNQISNGLVVAYAKLFFALTQRLERRAEFAADALATRLVGPQASISGLQKMALHGAMYGAYLTEVENAVNGGAFPRDFMAGYASYAAFLGERGVVDELKSALARQSTEKYDSHPAIHERVAAIEGAAYAARVANLMTETQPDARPAAELFGFDMEKWLVDWILALPSLRALTPPLAITPWKEMGTIFGPQILPSAHALAQRFQRALPTARNLPEFLAGVLAGIMRGELVNIAWTIEPELHRAPVYLRTRIATEIVKEVVLVLFCGAMVERGAQVGFDVGHRTLLDWRGTQVPARRLVTDAFSREDARMSVLAWSAMLVEDAAAADARAAAEAASAGQAAAMA